LDFWFECIPSGNPGQRIGGNFCDEMIEEKRLKDRVKTRNQLEISADRPRVARWYIFKPKIQIWKKIEDHRMENVGILYAPLEYVMAIWYSLWSFVVIWHIFPRFGILCQEKSGDPGSSTAPPPKNEKKSTTD
jgi:hypothetical protein